MAAENLTPASYIGHHLKFMQKPVGDGSFWTDTEQLKYHIRKAGVAPSDATYDILVKNKPGYPDVAGWGPASFRSTDGFVRHSLGSTIEHNGLGGNAAYWRKS